MLQFLLTACGALALGVALTVFLTAVKVSRVRLRPMDGRRIDLTRAPAAARGVLDIGRAWLLPRGFRYRESTFGELRLEGAETAGEREPFGKRPRGDALRKKCRQSRGAGGRQLGGQGEDGLQRGGEVFAGGLEESDRGENAR